MNIKAKLSSIVIAGFLLAIVQQAWAAGPETALTAQTRYGQSATGETVESVPIYSLVVWTYDGNRAFYDFADKPEITINGNIFTVSSAKTTVSYLATDINMFTIEETDLQVVPSDGDINSDGGVDIADISAVLSVLSGNRTDPTSVRKADVNGDHTIDVADISAILSIMATKY